jgi:transposase, IS5 family
MSICYEGLSDKIIGTEIRISVKDDHKLLRLANSLPWEKLSRIVLPDLQCTTSKFRWWVGRSLQLRTHLGVYLLQQLFNETDRGIERQIQDNAAYRIFCGMTIVQNWRCPDHTKIEEFRSRLSKEAQCRLANEIAILAFHLGFAKPAHIDIDSTIQEANISYPAISTLLVKIAELAKKITEPLFKLGEDLKKQIPIVNMKEVKAKARSYFILHHRKTTTNEVKEQQARDLWGVVISNVLPVIRFCHELEVPWIKQRLSNYLKRSLEQFERKCIPFLDNSFENIFNKIKNNPKIYSFHLDEIDCFNKNKANKKLEFGRAYQLERIKGNFMTVSPCTSIRMPDAESLKTTIERHKRLFNNISIESVSADKGYYSKENERYLLMEGVKEVGLQRPNRKLVGAPYNPIDDNTKEKLSNRRAGIEPLIGHLKQGWQMGRSRMKSDRATENAGYCSVLGFNLRQLGRYLVGEVEMVT